MARGPTQRASRRAQALRGVGARGCRGRRAAPARAGAGPRAKAAGGSGIAARGPCRDAHHQPPRALARVGAREDAALHQPGGVDALDCPGESPQRQALARRRDGPALDGGRDPRRRAQLPAREGSPRAAEAPQRRPPAAATRFAVRFVRRARSRTGRSAAGFSAPFSSGTRGPPWPFLCRVPRRALSGYSTTTSVTKASLPPASSVTVSLTK